MNQFFAWKRCASLVGCTGFLLIAGCAKHSHESGHDHDHEPRTAQITVWGDHHEIFAEHLLAVAGVPTKFVTHITDLKTSEPRRQGPVTFRLQQGDSAPLEHPEPAPSRAGIYEAKLTFPNAGDWNVSVTIPGADVESTVVLPAIKVFATQHDADHAEIPEPPEGISFLKEQQWKILSKTEQVAKRVLVERLRVPARVRAKPGLSATFLAPQTGQLAGPGEEPLAQPGQEVEAGQLILLLKPNFSEVTARIAEAEGEFAAARAALEQAETVYARTKKLAEAEAKSPRELQEAEFALRAAKVRFSAATGLLGTFREAGAVGEKGTGLMLELRAPISGVLNSLTAGAGELIRAEEPLFTVLNTEQVWIEGQVPEMKVARLSAAKEALVEVISTLGPFNTLETPAKLVSISLEVHPETRTVPILFELSNSARQLRIGQSVNLHIETAKSDHSVAIPESALVEEGDQLIAFVQVSGETFQKREIKAGMRDAGWVQVLGGIEAGERVVTKGAYAIRLASVSGVIPEHGHVH